MSRINRKTHDSNGNITYLKVYDETNDEIVETDEAGNETRRPLTTEEQQAHNQAERQTARAQRLADAIDSLKGALELTASEPLETGIVDPAVRRELRAIRTRQAELATATRAHRIILRDIIDEDA